MTMTISTQTQRAIAPLIRGMATAGTLPKTEANAVVNLLKEASNPKKQNSTTTAKPRMLKASKTAELLGMCTRSILRMNKAGQLHGVKLTGSNKSLRFSETEIEKFINLRD